MTVNILRIFAKVGVDSIIRTVGVRVVVGFSISRCLFGLLCGTWWCLIGMYIECRGMVEARFVAGIYRFRL